MSQTATTGEQQREIQEGEVLMKPNGVDGLDFLLGEWQLDYHIPKSRLAGPGSDRGAGTFRRVLGDKYVVFDYATDGGGAAHGIFAWDSKSSVLRYWWFENSGSFQTASCEFLDQETLAVNWHDTVLVQTFTRVSQDRVVLRMRSPTANGAYELVLEVVLTRRRTIG
jgi:hypothetical protein